MYLYVYPAGQGKTDDRGIGAGDATVRIAGALLALAVAAVHVADQGGVTVLTSPHWLGWGFRLIEVGGVLTAVALLLPRSMRFGPGWARPAYLGWAAGVLLGAGPFLGYLTTRTVGLPGDSQDIGNWGGGAGPVSLFVEAALVVLSIRLLVSLRRRVAGPARARAGAAVMRPLRLREGSPDPGAGGWAQGVLASSPQAGTAVGGKGRGPGRR